MRQSMLAVPDDLLDVARVDGAGEWRLFFQIVLPVVRPSLAALALILFLNQWNDYLWPLIVLSQEGELHHPRCLGNLGGARPGFRGPASWPAPWWPPSPSLILFLILQRNFIAGIVGGAIKE